MSDTNHENDTRNTTFSLLLPRPRVSVHKDLFAPILYQLRLHSAPLPLLLVLKQSLLGLPRIPPTPFCPQPHRLAMWIAQPRLDRSLLVLDNLWHARRIDPHKRHARRRNEADGGAVCRDQTPALEGVADDGELCRPGGMPCTAPELDEREEDVLVRVEGALFELDAWMERDGRQGMVGGRRGDGGVVGKKVPI